MGKMLTARLFIPAGFMPCRLPTSPVICHSSFDSPHLKPRTATSVSRHDDAKQPTRAGSARHHDARSRISMMLQAVGRFGFGADGGADSRAATDREFTSAVLPIFGDLPAARRVMNEGDSAACCRGRSSCFCMHALSTFMMAPAVAYAVGRAPPGGGDLRCFQHGRYGRCRARQCVPLMRWANVPLRTRRPQTRRYRRARYSRRCQNGAPMPDAGSSGSARETQINHP